VQEIVETPISARADALDDAVRRHTGRIEARAQVFRIQLYLVAVILVGNVAYQSQRLRMSARALRRANANLQREVAERRRAAAALATSEERFRAITESAHDAIVSVDAGGCIVSWNPRPRRSSGTAPARSSGAHSSVSCLGETAGSTRRASAPARPPAPPDGRVGRSSCPAGARMAASSRWSCRCRSGRRLMAAT